MAVGGGGGGETLLTPLEWLRPPQFAEMAHAQINSYPVSLQLPIPAYTELQTRIKQIGCHINVHFPIYKKIQSFQFTQHASLWAVGGNQSTRWTPMQTLGKYENITLPSLN